MEELQKYIGTRYQGKHAGWVCTAAAPYVRRDGGASGILTWQVDCPLCGHPKVVTTGLTGWDKANNFQLTPYHRGCKPPKRARKNERF